MVGKPSGRIDLPRQRSVPLVELAAAAWLAFDPVFWTVCQVSEMYSLWVLCAVGLMVLAAEVAVETVALLGEREPIPQAADGITWADKIEKDGKTTYYTKVMVDQLVMLDSKGEHAQTEAAPAPEFRSPGL